MRPISSKEFFEIRDRLNEQCEEIMKGKNPVYTIGSDNYVKNFQSIAERLGTSGSHVALTYLHKHFDAIVSHVVKGEVKDVEAIDSRFADARNYLDILYALVKTEAQPTIKVTYANCRDDATISSGDEYEFTGGPI